MTSDRLLDHELPLLGLTVQQAGVGLAISGLGWGISQPLRLAASALPPQGKAISLGASVLVDSSFGVAGVQAAMGEIEVSDTVGIVVGTIAGAFFSGVIPPLAVGFVAGFGVKQAIDGTVNLYNGFSNLEDPDGGFNGAGMVSPGYGSARAPSDTDGRGVGIRRGDEENALDQIARETPELGLKIPAWSKPDWTDHAADPLDFGLTAAPGQDTHQGYDLYYGYDPRNPQPVPDPAPVTGPVGGPPPGTGSISSGGGRPGGSNNEEGEDNETSHHNPGGGSGSGSYGGSVGSGPPGHTERRQFVLTAPPRAMKNAPPFRAGRCVRLWGAGPTGPRPRPGCWTRSHTIRRFRAFRSGRG